MATEPVVDVPIDKSKYHFFLVPDAGGNPVKLSSDDFEELKKQAIFNLLQARSGWAYFVIEGVVCYLSTPTQVFKLRMPDGSMTELRQASGEVFGTDGKFQTLERINVVRD